MKLLLRRTASAYGMRKSRVVTFPTAVFIARHDDEREQVTLAQSEPQTLRLDQNLLCDQAVIGGTWSRSPGGPSPGKSALYSAMRR